LLSDITAGFVYVLLKMSFAAKFPNIFKIGIIAVLKIVKWHYSRFCLRFVENVLCCKISKYF